MERLSKLFGSPARLKVLRLFVFNQDTLFPLANIAERTKLSKDVVRHEVADLIAAGLLVKKSSRGAVGYKVNARFEHLTALNAFIRETTSVRPQKMVAALKRAGTLRLVALSGHFTSVLETQVDLLVVGDNLEERVLTHVVSSLEAELGREIRMPLLQRKISDTVSEYMTVFCGMFSIIHTVF